MPTGVAGSRDSEPLRLQAHAHGESRPKWGMSGGTLLAAVPQVAAERWLATALGGFGVARDS